jgi:hypothetical protein
MCGGVALKAGIDFAKGCEFFDVEISGTSQGCIEYAGYMAVGKEKYVFALCIHMEVRVLFHDAEIKADEIFSAAQ